MSGVYRRRVQPTQRRRFYYSATTSQTFEDGISLSYSRGISLFTGFGAFAFGEQNPTQGEQMVPWSTWRDSVGSPVIVTGDPDWGKLQLNPTADDGHSLVYDMGTEESYQFTLTRNRYGTGGGTATLQIRGSTGTFPPEGISPVWEDYTIPITRTWRYVQVREVTL